MTRRRTDENQKRIVYVLRSVGCRVFDSSAVGKGFPDLVVYRPATDGLFLLEIKDGGKSPSRRRLTPDQQKFHQEFPVQVVASEEEALKAVGIQSSS